MNPSKLKTLEKQENQSMWQIDQSKINYNNGQFFLDSSTVVQDPWQMDKAQKEVIMSNIPVLKNISDRWGTRHRNNREVNNLIRMEKIKATMEMFKK